MATPDIKVLLEKAEEIDDLATLTLAKSEVSLAKSKVIRIEAEQIAKKVNKTLGNILTQVDSIQSNL